MKNETTNTTANATTETTANVIAKIDNENRKTYKLNRELFADWTSNETNRSTDEETETKPRTIHLPRPTNRKGTFTESTGYYNIRKFAFDLTKTEYRTPQNNLDLIVNRFNSDAKITNKIVRTSYIAKTYTVRVFFADDTTGNFIALDVSRPLDASKTLTRLIQRSTGTNRLERD
jgi:hypothetical protein